MPVLNSKKREIDIKIVYYGPALCGKTTNLQTVFKKLAPHQRGDMVSLATKDDRTLFFDFLPIELGNVKGYKTRFHVYTVPGQVYYGLTRRAVLTNFDGVIFIADSQIGKMEENLESFNDLEENLRFYKKDIYSIPFVLQYNKRDLPNLIPIEELNDTLNKLQSPYFEACAINGPGGMETLTACCKQVLRQLDESSAKQDAPVVKLYMEPEPPRAYVPVEPATQHSDSFQGDSGTYRGRIYSEESAIKPSFAYRAIQDDTYCEAPDKTEASETGQGPEPVRLNSRAAEYRVGESTAPDVQTSGVISEADTKPCGEDQSAGCLPQDFLSSLSVPRPEEGAAMQGPIIRISNVSPASCANELSCCAATDETLSIPEGLDAIEVSAAPELSEIPPCPVARISIDSIEEDMDTVEELDGFSGEDQLQTVPLAQEDTNDFAAYYAAAVTEDKIITEQHVEMSALPGVEGAANFTIVACGQPHKETATAVKIPLIFKIEELNKECLVNLIINFNDFTMREPR
jgi:hypothetical protein